MGDADQRPAPSGEDRTFYVINLCAAPVPLPLDMPQTAGLEGLVVFRSHEVQDGRHRYRLHLGYFESRAAAEAKLPRVKPTYPTAWIAAAPHARLGSLDDTGNTDFRLIQAPGTAFSSFSAAESPPAYEVRKADLEEPQRYAVQLVWSSERCNPADLPQIALFDAYTLYTVTCQRGGVRLYGVRLGFFRSAISASQVAVYVRPDFPSVAVVPVSDREFAFASWLVRHRGEHEPSVGRGPRRPTAEATHSQEDAAVAQAGELAPPPEPNAEQAQVPTATEEAPWESSIARHTPTQVEIAQIRSPEDVTLTPMDAPYAAPTVRTPATQHWGYAPRPPELDREARLAALSAHELQLRAAKGDPHDERGATLPDQRPYRSNPFPERRSALARLLTRITDRLG